MNNLSDSELGQLTRAFYNAINVNPQATLSALQAISPAKETAEPEQATEPVNILRRIYADEKIIVPACDAEDELPTDKKLFPGYLSSDFANWEDKSNLTSPETEAVVTEMQRNAKFPPMFNSLNSDLDKLCWSKNQIKKFVIKNRDKLHPKGWATFFLCKIDGDYRVAYVCWDSPGGLRVVVYHFDVDDAWDAADRYRVVAPATAVD